MVKRERVTKDIDEGINFEQAGHNHWLIDNDNKDIAFMLIMLIIPPIIISVGYSLSHDIILAQMIY